MLEKAGCQVRAMGSQGPALFPRLQECPLRVYPLGWAGISDL